MREHLYSKTGRRRDLLLIAVLLGALLSALYLWRPSFVAFLNGRTTDAVMALAPEKQGSRSVVIVDIDEKTLGRYGRWPWPRSLLAQLLGILAQSGAAAIGVDVILAEPDRTPPSGPIPDHDLVLAKTLAKGPFVPGYAFVFSNSHASQPKSALHPPSIILVNLPDPALKEFPLFTARGVTYNLPAFSSAVRRSGFLNATPDADGILRKVPALVRFEDTLYPSFALAALMEYENQEQITIVRREAIGGLDVIIGDRTIPLDRHGNLRVRFSRAGYIPRVSASEVLPGRNPQERFRGKAVVVGSSAAGLESTFVTADGTLQIGSEVHAQVLDSLLTGERVVRTGEFFLWEVLFSIPVMAGAVWAVMALRILPGAVICGALAAGTWICAALVFRQTGYLFSPLLPTVLVVPSFMLLTMVKTWMALVEKQLQLERINVDLEQRVTDAVSDLRNKDQLLIQQGRQAAMGEMINNIAHQWRQPLNLLGLIVQDLRLSYGRPEFNREKVDDSVVKAMKLIQHMSQTIEDFRSYFKPEKEKSHFLASQAVERTLALVGPSLTAMEIEVEVRGSEEVEIFGYPNEYSQVLLNILLNCRDAFEGCPAGKKRGVTIEIGRQGDRSVVAVTDNAGGIPEEVIAKVFDPYFTTKAPDKGTGIGLYMAKMIIEKNMGGRLTVRNTAGGAQFRIEV